MNPTEIVYARQANYYIITAVHIYGESEMGVPTDQGWLEKLYRQYKDDTLIEMLQLGATITDVDAEIQKAIDEGVVRNSDRQALYDLALEMASPRRMLQGKFVDVLRSMTLALIAEYKDRVANVPVGLLPTRHLNACAIPTPRGGTVILLDWGVIFLLPHIVRNYVGFSSWYSDEPFLRDHSQADFLRTLLLLAEHCVTGAISPLQEVTTYKLPSRPYYDKEVQSGVTLIEWFVLLHEYGHVILNHLETKNTKTFQLHQGYKLKLYSTSQRQEFEADEFAFNRIMSATTDKMFPTDIAFFVGILLKFFHLCEFMRPVAFSDKNPSHPPTSERWNRIKVMAAVEDKPACLAMKLDHTFNVIMQAAVRHKNSRKEGKKSKS